LRPLRLRLPPIWTLIWGDELFNVIDVGSAVAAKLSPGKKMTPDTSINANTITFFLIKCSLARKFTYLFHTHA
jgi:hypothetical protein